MSESIRLPRRQFLQRTAVLGGAALSGLPAILRAQQAPGVVVAGRPAASWGLQLGDVGAERAIVWSRADQPARMFVEWSLRESFRNPVRLRGPHALEESDCTSRVDLAGLPPDEDIYVRVVYESLDNAKARSEPVVGRFRTAPGQRGWGKRRRDVRFVWGGDTAGQGWGINPDFGGMKLYEAMRRTNPDFFIHSGDTIYADGPMQESIATPFGPWTNAFLDEVPEKRKVAETLREFHRNYLYNLYDANVQRFNAEVPQIWQWDDHEVTNNWSDSKDLSGDARYAEKRVQTLVARATKAFLDYAPLRWNNQTESERVYRHVPYSRDLDVFVIDMRSYRGPNTDNLQPEQGPETAFLGRAQLEWLKRKLDDSRATWKVIAADMPIGLRVPDGPNRWEAIANGNDGPALGRELEIAELLRFIKRNHVCNVVWLTADVHYCAAHYYDPARAQFTDFDPFWEFVSGPLHAGSFGPNTLDLTFGPQVVFQRTPPAGQANLPPSAGLQFFGQVDIDARSKEMVVALKDIDGDAVFTRRLQPRPCRGWDD